MCRRVFVADPIFGGLDRNTQKLIAANMTPLHLLPGHTLCQQGGVADRIWLLQEGVLFVSTLVSMPCIGS